MNVFIHAYGCQMNKLDAEMVLSALRQAGYGQADDPDEADVILFVTCSVRVLADELLLKYNGMNFSVEEVVEGLKALIKDD